MKCVCSMRMADPTPNRSPGLEEPPAAFQVEGDTPGSQIWTTEEKTILRSHVEGYRSAGRQKKSAYVVKEVIPQIKASWRGRYDKKRLKNNRALKKEWDKKKDVS